MNDLYYIHKPEHIVAIKTDTYDENVYDEDGKVESTSKKYILDILLDSNDGHYGGRLRINMDTEEGMIAHFHALQRFLYDGLKGSYRQVIRED